MLRREANTIFKLEELKSEGFKRSYGIRNTRLFDAESSDTYDPAKFEVVKEFRFEGLTEASDGSILLALQHEETGAKGTLLAPYGSMASPETKQVLQALEAA